MRRHFVASVGSLLAVAACTPAAPGSASAPLFPLEPGHRWTYRQQVVFEDGSEDATWLRLDTLPAESFEDRPAFRRRSSEGADYWLRRDASGIVRVASKSELEDLPHKDAAPRYVLKEPIAIGTEWQATTLPYLLRRRAGGFPPELRHEHKQVDMRYTIAALDETVTVPAGRWEGCVKVSGQAAFKVYADPTSGWKDLPLTTTEWYCPGPGLVKLRRDEPARSPFLTGGSLTLELHAWQRP